MHCFSNSTGVPVPRVLRGKVAQYSVPLSSIQRKYRFQRRCSSKTAGICPIHSEISVWRWMSSVRLFALGHNRCMKGVNEISESCVFVEAWLIAKIFAAEIKRKGGEFDKCKVRDTPIIDHLVMREFVSGPPSYRSIYERDRDRKPSLRKGSKAVCGFRTEFFEKRHFFGSSFSFKFRVFEENSPFVDYTSHAHASCIRSQTLTAIPRQVSAAEMS